MLCVLSLCTLTFYSSFGKDHLAKITIEIGTAKGSMFFQAHGLVLSLASKVFHSAIIESKKRKEPVVFQLIYQNPHAYWRMIEWIYTGEYSHESSSLPDFSGMSSWVFSLLLASFLFLLFGKG